MLVIYYYDADGNRTWIKCGDMERAEKFIADNGIEEYSITIAEHGYQHMKNTIDCYKKQMAYIKKMIAECSD